MNLRVDLILESEQRSASVINKKSLIRISAIVVPLAVLTLLVNQVTGMMKLKSRLVERETEWKSLESRQRAAERLAQECEANSSILKELQGWRKSHVDWHQQLIGLLREVPRDVQLTGIKINQTLQVVNDKTPARLFTTTLKGKAIGAEAESSVMLLERRLKEAAVFSSFTTNIEVKRFGADPAAGAGKQDRVFEILWSYRGCKFE